MSWRLLADLIGLTLVRLWDEVELSCFASINKMLNIYLQFEYDVQLSYNYSQIILLALITRSDQL